MDNEARRTLVVSYGMGLDSTAMLVEMHNRGIRPDLVLFSNTGAEKPETYAYLDIIDAWLVKVGFPTVTVVSYDPPRAPYTDLESKCLANETMPSIVFNPRTKHSCALVFKRDAMVKYLKGWKPGLAAIGRGERIVKAVGYDDSAADRKRRTRADAKTEKMRLKVLERTDVGKRPLAEMWEAAHCDFWYPLADWGLDRAALTKIIEAAGLPVPVKSACFFCPASKPEEVVELKLKHPDLYRRAVEMERRAYEGKHARKRRAAGLSVIPGLGIGGWAWAWLADCNDPAAAKAAIKEHGASVSEDDALRP